MVRASIFFVLLVFCVAFGVFNANAQSFLTEGFEVVPPFGWTIQNNSSPIGTSSWQQGNPAIFPAQAGPPNSYAMANFNNTSGTGTISSWLISPQLILVNGATIKFWTRTAPANPFPDRMQVRVSTNGASTNVGTTATSVGDFTNLMLDINPTYDTGGVYPEVWTQFTITLAGLPAPTNGRVAFRYFVQNGGPTGENSNVIGVDTFDYYSLYEPPMGKSPADFNGDGKTDWVVLRNIGGGANGQVRWFWSLSDVNSATGASDWGLASDRFFTKDFDGDLKHDIACWRPGVPGVAAFYILQSATNTVRVEAFGQTGDDPSIVDDYNGDGEADLAVYRGGSTTGDQSVWFYRTTPNGAVNYVPWGKNGDYPIPGDFDGNGLADFVIQRISDGVGQFWTKLSTGIIQPVVNFGGSDRVVPGDYDGDGKTDIAVVRANSGFLIWYWKPSGGGASGQITFGLSTDVPTQGDYDGDGKTDIAIWRASPSPNQSAFWTRSSSSGTIKVFVFGSDGDYPVANFNVH